MGFINFFSTRATGFDRQGKHFKLNFFVRKTFLHIVKPDGQNHPHSWSVCLVPSPYEAPLCDGKYIMPQDSFLKTQAPELKITAPTRLQLCRNRAHF